MLTCPQLDNQSPLGDGSFLSGQMTLGFADATNLQGCLIRVRPRKHWKRAFAWHCSLAGRAPERALRNTDTFVLNLCSYRLACARPPQLRASDLCRDRLLGIIRAAARLPESYNKILIQGVADYCSTLVCKLDDKQEAEKQLLNQVRRFTSELEALCSQFTGQYSGSFALLDLRVIEDKFDMIQSESAHLGTLPALRDIPTADLVAAPDRHARIA